MVYLTDRASARQEMSVRPGTAVNRRSALKLFVAFACHYKLDYNNPTVADICVFIEYLTLHFKSPSSISNYVTNVKSCLIRMGANTQGFADVKVRDALNAISMTLRHTPRQAPPITFEHFKSVLEVIQSDPQAPTLALALIIMFLTMMRQSNVVVRGTDTFDPTRHLTRADVSGDGEQIRVPHKWAKNWQRCARSEDFTLSALPGSPVCPVQAFRRVLSHRPASSRAPLLIIATGAPLSLNYLNAAWSAAIRVLGLTRCGYTLHSVRRGAATAIQPHVHDEEHIKIYGRWKSNAYTKYIKDKANVAASRAFKALAKE